MCCDAQQALTHPSFRLNYGTNADHARNSLTNCGKRQLEYGDKRIHFIHTRKRGKVFAVVLDTFMFVIPFQALLTPERSTVTAVIVLVIRVHRNRWTTFQMFVMTVVF